MSKQIRLWLYAALGVFVVSFILWLQVRSMWLLLGIYAAMFLVAMQFGERGVAHSIPAGPYSLWALCIYLGTLGLLAVLLAGNYVRSVIGAAGFFDLMKSVQRLEVFVHHVPLLVLAGMLGGLAVLGYVLTARQHKLPNFVVIVLDRSFILFLLAGTVVATSSIRDRIYTIAAPIVTGEPDILDQQAVYETFVDFETQLRNVLGYVSQAREDAANTSLGETLCVALPGPWWSSDSLRSKAFLPSTLEVVDAAPMLLESWQLALTGIERYEQVGVSMVQSRAGQSSWSPSFEPDGYIECGKHSPRIATDIEASLELLEEAQQLLSTWAELNGGTSAPGGTQAFHKNPQRGSL